MKNIDPKDKMDDFFERSLKDFGEEPPEDLWDRLSENIPPKPAAFPFKLQYLAYAAVAASVILLATFAWIKTDEMLIGIHEQIGENNEKVLNINLKMDSMKEKIDQLKNHQEELIVDVSEKQGEGLTSTENVPANNVTTNGFSNVNDDLADNKTKNSLNKTNVNTTNANEKTNTLKDNQLVFNNYHKEVDQNITEEKIPENKEKYSDDSKVIKQAKNDNPDAEKEKNLANESINQNEDSNLVNSQENDEQLEKEDDMAHDKVAVSEIPVDENKENQTNIENIEVIPDNNLLSSNVLDSISPKTKDGKFFIGLNAAPVYSHRKVKNMRQMGHMPQGAHPDFQEANILSLHTGISFGYKLSDKLALCSGVNYMATEQENSRMILVNYNSAEEEPAVLNEVKSSYEYEASSSYGNSNVAIDVVRAEDESIPEGEDIMIRLKMKQKLKYITVPVGFKYFIGNEKLNLVLGTGAELIYLADNKQEITNAYSEHQKVRVLKADMPHKMNDCNKLSVGAVVSAGVAYNIGDFIIHCEPFYRRNLSAEFRNTMFSTKPYSYGINFGICYTI